MAKGNFFEATHDNAQRWADIVNAARNKNTLSLANDLLLYSSDSFDSQSGKGSAPAVDQSGNQESPFGRLMDILTAPLAAVAGGAQAVTDIGQEIASGDFDLGDLGRIPDLTTKGAAANLYSAATGDPNLQNKQSFENVSQDILNSMGAAQAGYKPNEVKKFLEKYENVDKPALTSGVDFGASMLFDPLNFVPGLGLAGKLGKAGKVAAEVGEDAASIARPALEAAPSRPALEGFFRAEGDQTILPGMENLGPTGTPPRRVFEAGPAPERPLQQETLPGFESPDIVRAQTEIPGAFPKVVGNNEPALFGRQAFEGDAASRAQARALNAERGVDNATPTPNVQDEFNTAGLLFTKGGDPYKAFVNDLNASTKAAKPPTPKPKTTTAGLAPDVADALAPVAAKKGIDVSKLGAVRDAAKIRSLVDEPMFIDDATPVAKATKAGKNKVIGEKSDEPLRAHISDVMQNKVGFPGIKGGDKLAVEFPNGVVRDINAGAVASAMLSGKIPDPIKGIKLSLESGKQVSIEDLVKGAGRVRASGSRPAAASTAASGTTLPTTRMVSEAWRQAAKAAGLSDREINKVLTSKDAKAELEKIATKAQGRAKATNKSNADAGVVGATKPESVAKPPDEIINSGEATERIAQTQANVEAAAQALRDIEKTHPRVHKAIDSATRFEAKQIDKDPRSRPTPEVAKKQKEAIGRTYSQKTVGGVKRNNPVHQRQLLSRLGWSEAVRKFAIPRAGQKMTHERHLMRAARLLPMLKIAEEQMKFLGYPPMTFMGENASFRLSEFFAAVAKDIDTTVEDLLVRMGYTGKGRAAEDAQLLKDIDNALKLGNNKGLRDMAKVYPSVQEYLHAGQGIQKQIDAVNIPKIEAEAADALAIRDDAAGIKLTTDAQDYKTVTHDIPIVVNELTAAAGASDDAANHVISEMAERIMPRTDNLTAETAEKTARQPAAKVKNNDPTVDSQNAIFKAADNDMGVGNASQMGKISRTQERIGRVLLSYKGYKNLYDIHMNNLYGFQALSNLAQHVYGKAIRDLKITPDTFRNGWAVLRGEERAVTPEISDAIQFIEQRMGNILHDSTVANQYRVGMSDTLRAGITKDEWNRALKQQGIDFRFTDEVGEGETWMDSWRYYSGEKDPFTLAFQLESTMHMAASKKAVLADLHHMFHKTSGGVRVKNVPELANTMVDPIIAKEIPVLMKRMNEAFDPGGPFGRAVDSFLSSWKSGVTIYLPSHHIRNMIGDMTFAWFAGVPIGDPRLIAKTQKVFRAKKSLYSDIKPDADGAQMLTEMLKGNRIDNLPVAESDVISRIAGKGGKSIDITADMFYQGAFERGVIKHSRLLEDIPSRSISETIAEKHPALRAIFRPTGGRAQHAGRTVSESREHAVRLQHFIHKTEKYTKRNISRGMNNDRALKLAMDEASNDVRKWHPDGTTLTDWERKYMRRIFPFYSWTRKAIPLLAETMLTNPAKLTLYPKGMYYGGQAMGVESQDLANPWPVDQMFPQWLREMPIGPMFGDAESGYTVMNPGTPFTDLGNQFINDPISGVVGMANPLLRIPAEIATRTDAQTTAPIKDWSEYTDKQIPPLALINRLFNTNIGAGTLENIIGGNPGVGLNKTGKVEGVGNQYAITNFLTAAGLINASKPNYVKQAEYEQKDRAAERARIRREELARNG